jgi:hypothetical protein
MGEDFDLPPSAPVNTQAFELISLLYLLKC